MTTLGIEQSVTGLTQRCGHTLDVAISRENDNLVENTHVLDLISDTLLLYVHFEFGSLLLQRELLPRANTDPLTVSI